MAVWVCLRVTLAWVGLVCVPVQAVPCCVLIGVHFRVIPTPCTQARMMQVCNLHRVHFQSVHLDRLPLERFLRTQLLPYFGFNTALGKGVCAESCSKGPMAPLSFAAGRGLLTFIWSDPGHACSANKPPSTRCCQMCCCCPPALTCTATRLSRKAL